MDGEPPRGRLIVERNACGTCGGAVTKPPAVTASFAQLRQREHARCCSHAVSWTAGRRVALITYRSWRWDYRFDGCQPRAVATLRTQSIRLSGTLVWSVG